jgi:hypothetical protein
MYLSPSKTRKNEKKKKKKKKKEKEYVKGPAELVNVRFLFSLSPSCWGRRHQ